jgi:hypothetical protein
MFQRGTPEEQRVRARRGRVAFIVSGAIILAAGCDALVATILWNPSGWFFPAFYLGFGTFLLVTGLTQWLSKKLVPAAFR